MTPVQAAKKTFFTPELIENPYPIYQRFLEEGPAHYLDRGPGPGIWGIFSYADCASLLKDQRVSAKRSDALLAGFTPEQRAGFAPLAEMLRYWMLFLDPPQHSRLRKLMTKGFSPAVMEALRAPITAIVDEMLGSLKGSSEAELMQQVAHPLPVRVIGKMLGISDEMQPQLVQWSDAIATFFGNPRRTVEQAAATQDAVLSLTGYFRGVVAKRRSAKGSDLISLLLEIEEDGEVLTEEELYAQCVMLLFAGHETTRNLIGNGMLTLLRHPGEAGRLRDDPTLIRSGVEELLRYESPVQNTGRVVMEEMELCGTSLSPGAIVYVMLGSANRDPRHFPDPAMLNLARPNNNHLGFGAGAHFCIGSQLARLEAQAAVLGLIQRFPKMSCSTDSPRWRPNFVLRGLSSLPVSLV